MSIINELGLVIFGSTLDLIQGKELLASSKNCGSCSVHMSLVPRTQRGEYGWLYLEVPTVQDNEVDKAWQNFFQNPNCHSLMVAPDAAVV